MQHECQIFSQVCVQRGDQKILELIVSAEFPLPLGTREGASPVSRNVECLREMTVLTAVATSNDFLFKIYRTFKQTMMKANVWGAFQEDGFEFDTSSEPYRLHFNQEK
jgi:hypothetical protein